MIARGFIARSRVPRLAMMLLASVLLLVAVPDTALADWDPDQFVSLQEKADTQFTGARYDDALQTYLELKVMLENALDNDEIGSKMREPAKQALGTIKYQIGRCLQLTNDCAEAFAAYRTLESSDDLPADVRLKVDVRLAETALCLAEVNQDGDNYDAARSNLARAREYLKKAKPLNTYGELTEASREEVQQDLDTAVARADTTAARLFDHYSTTVMAKVEQEDCQGAQVSLSRAERDVPDSRSSEADALRKAVQNCGVVVSPDDPPPDEGSYDVPVAAWVVFSVGLATLGTWGVWEVLNMEKVDDYNQARDDCRNFQPTCQEALDLGDELETAQIVSWSLISVGGALTLAGTTWLIIAYAASDDEAPAGETTLHFTPTPDGAMVGLEWTLP